MSVDPSDKLKSAKDSLVSSLFELSKSASSAASNIIDFYNAIGEDEEEKIEAFTTLTESLQKLTSATNTLHGISSELTNPMEDEKEIVPPVPVVSVKQPRKRIPRDPNAPKKPLTVFFAYSAYIRQEIRDDREKRGETPLSSTEITQEISKKWKELSDSEKEKWKQAYNIELEHYQLEKQKYLEAKKNGSLPTSNGIPTHAPVGIPSSLQSIKRSHDDSGSSEKKKKKKKKDKKKDSN
ncbi:hypothetical protein TPHA_0C02460 [Tetrapisispora phaffii CBS 4417]|uniref:HMG box domain-containing protein n=1 Tax=Tetrapisispora phaffii (strain ATCC 24235 / CBS 4417 / NBRC 1672 / NRRL Y-8282 / UCD 70-5) TaxID=1071381 RepID=G8BRM3_TETPH|nr:hypothetical protein TPHA_0C02460 [Tetrapisispora phaffii CBS 4417]CCE62399.1 hypothetical protein TPHA_0C02460 [Tetrapisispora phaffii CBS 4417]